MAPVWRSVASFGATTAAVAALAESSLANFSAASFAAFLSASAAAAFACSALFSASSLACIHS